MKQLPSYLKKSVYSAVTFFGTIVLLSVWYATLFGGLSTADKVSTGSGLTATSWNRIIDGVLDLDSKVSNFSFSGGNIGIGATNPGAKLEVNGDMKISGGIVWTGFGQSFVSIMPNDMSFPAGGFITGSSTAPMPIGTYYYQLYWCNGQNDFVSGAVGTFIFISGSWNSTGTSYFGNANVWWGSCGYFRNWFLQITVPNSVVQFKISGNSWGWNIDSNPTANSFSATVIKIL